jgi:hypothetical protein
MQAGPAERYGGANPDYGMGADVIDYSIEEVASNGSIYYKSRDRVRTFDMTVEMDRDEAIKLYQTFLSIGKQPTGWRLTDLPESHWVVFGRMTEAPKLSHDYYNTTIVQLSLQEVL